MFDLNSASLPQDAPRAVQLYGSGGSSGMNDAEIFALVMSLAVTVFGFVLLVVWMTNRAKARAERLRIMEEALRSERLDAAAKQELVAALTGREQSKHGPAWQRLAFGAGWMGLMVGLIMLFSDNREIFQSGMVVGGLGLACMTLPLALREFDRASAAPRGRPEA